MNAAVLAIIQAAIVLVAGATAVWWGGVAVTWVFGRLSPAAETAVLRGGEWIGRVERTAVFATVLTGFPEGIAIALALKGIGRYPELKTGSKVASERFIIGTFVSLLAAAGLAV